MLKEDMPTSFTVKFAMPGILDQTARQAPQSRQACAIETVQNQETHFAAVAAAAPSDVDAKCVPSVLSRTHVPVVRFKHHEC